MDSCTLISTSAFITKELEERARENANAIGLTRITFDRIKKQFMRKWAGTPDARLEQLQNAFSQEEQIIWNCFGESGIIQFIDAIKYKPANRITLIGSSDCSLLVNKFYEATKMQTIYGPNASTKIDEDSLKLLTKNINREELKGTCKIIQKGTGKNITGIIKGGNLISLTWGIGLQHEIDLRNCIVFFDKLGKDNHSTYNNIIQLYNSKRFKPKAIVIRRLATKNVKQLKSMLKELFVNIPIVFAPQFGLQAKKLSFPIGGKCTLNLEKKTISIKPKNN